MIVFWLHRGARCAALPKGGMLVPGCGSRASGVFFCGSSDMIRSEAAWRGFNYRAAPQFPSGSQASK